MSTRKNLHSTYYMTDTALESINEEKDLGIFITGDLVNTLSTWIYQSQ